MKMLRMISSLAVTAGFTWGAFAFAADGKAIYEANCKSCHGEGKGGAPRFGNQEDWAERIATGRENLEASAINGLQGYSGNMPPRGGNPKLTNEEVKAAVLYIMNAVKK